MTDANDPRLDDFRAALHALMKDLALQVVRDGEGARKMVTVHVTGADDNHAADVIARSIANSPLVKTAVAGVRMPTGAVWSWPWARLAKRPTATGWPSGSAISALPSMASVTRIIRRRMRQPVMQENEITIRADIGLGDGQAKVYTCDLTKEYVAINGDYRS